MKNYFNISIKIMLFGFISTSLISCGDLKVQEKFVFQPGIPELATFKDQTAWEFIQKQTTPAGAVALAANKFDFMITLIRVAGLEEEYNKNIENRTYLFLNNAAFTGAGRINALLTGVTLGTGDLTKVDKVRAANLLKYHIIDAYVNQTTSLPLFFINYDFKTLLEGSNGVMKIQRNERYSITINNSAELPTTRRTTAVTLHNYQFKNGIAHIISSHVGITAF